MHRTISKISAVFLCLVIASIGGWELYEHTVDEMFAWHVDDKWALDIMYGREKSEAVVTEIDAVYVYPMTGVDNYEYPLRELFDKTPGKIIVTEGEVDSLISILRKNNCHMSSDKDVGPSFHLLFVNSAERKVAYLTSTVTATAAKCLSVRSAQGYTGIAGLFEYFQEKGLVQ